MDYGCRVISGISHSEYKQGHKLMHTFGHSNNNRNKSHINVNSKLYLVILYSKPMVAMINGFVLHASVILI